MLNTDKIQLQRPQHDAGYGLAKFTQDFLDRTNGVASKFDDRQRRIVQLDARFDAFVKKGVNRLNSEAKKAADLKAAETGQKQTYTRHYEWTALRAMWGQDESKFAPTTKDAMDFATFVGRTIEYDGIPDLKDANELIALFSDRLISDANAMGFISEKDLGFYQGEAIDETESEEVTDANQPTSTLDQVLNVGTQTPDNAVQNR